MTPTDENAGTSRLTIFSPITSNEFNIVNIDHCYSKPWSSHPDASNARPLRMMFMEKYPRLSIQEKQRSTDIIDVVGHVDNMLPILDAGKTKSSLPDYEVNHSDYADSREDWEDHIAAVRTTWSVLQNRIFAKVIRVLQADRLARLSIQETKNEPIQRRLQIDKAAKRVRFCFGSVGWDMTLILWLHNLFLENLRDQLLTSYLEVLETLKLKIPSLAEPLIQCTISKEHFALESMSGLLKKSSDPVLSRINQQKLKRLPDNPLLLLILSAASLNPVTIKRHKFWQHQLSAMGKVINIASVSNSSTTQISSYVENMMTITRSKILEVKGHYPGRPIILIGWHIGALLATHVALMESVQAVVCLGFPTMGIYGNRGEIDDQIYTCKTPTFFIVGQHATSSSIDTLEDIREKLKVETGLLVVGGADDQLRMSRAKKQICGVTQSMVDKCIMEEMFEFLGSILSQIAVKPEVTRDAEIIRKQRKRKQKDVSQVTDSHRGSVSQQPPVRTVKSLKLGSGGTLTFGGQWSMAGATKIVKKTSPKKHANKIESNMASSKKPMLRLSFPVLETSADQSGSLSKVSEAAAIASAPELSNLLQSIQKSGQQLLPSNASSLASKSIITPSSSTTITTTTALTLSRFLASSGFFRSGALVKAKETSDDLESVALKSSFGAFTDEAASEQLQLFDDPGTKQQAQILVRTGNSSVPLSIPLTFTMASKVLKSAPVMRITGSNSDSPHIQQLLTSVSGSSLPLITATSSAISQTSTAVSNSAFLINSGGTQPISKISPFTLGIASSSSPRSSALISKSVSAAGMGTLSPGASVINIESDSVFMKETFPSTVSVPGTVSIDLGQIATGTSSTVMKLTSTPKISLIPMVKQMPISGLTERLLLTAPTAGSQLSLATLSSLTHSQHSQLGKSTGATSVVTSLKPSVLVSTDSLKPLNTSVTSTSMITMSSSQLLSTLSSGTGLIALKLSTSCANTSISGKDDANRQANDSDTFLAQPKGNMNNQSQCSDHSSKTRFMSTSNFTQSGESDPHKKNWQMVSSAGSVTFPNPTSLIITSGNTLGAGQIVLQCQRTPSGSPQLQVMKTSSSLMTASTASETLGQVTSLLESSPVTIGNKQILQTPGFSSPSSSVQQMNTVLSPSESSTSSATSPVIISQAQTSLKSNKTVISSYTATSKPVLPTIASTRTRRIKTPKQYDL